MFCETRLGLSQFPQYAFRISTVMDIIIFFVKIFTSTRSSFKSVFNASDSLAHTSKLSRKVRITFTDQSHSVKLEPNFFISRQVTWIMSDLKFCFQLLQLLLCKDCPVQSKPQTNIKVQVAFTQAKLLQNYMVHIHIYDNVNEMVYVCV